MFAGKMCRRNNGRGADPTSDRQKYIVGSKSGTTKGAFVHFRRNVLHILEENLERGNIHNAKEMNTFSRVKVVSASCRCRAACQLR